MTLTEIASDIPELRYDRICRTPSSEAYLVSGDDGLIGRIDLHFGSSVVHGCLILERELAEMDIEAIVERIDEDLVWTADQPRDDFAVTVYHGREVTVISDPDEEEPDGEDDEE